MPVRPLFAVSALTIALTGIASAQMPSDIPAAPAQAVTTSGTVAAGITPVRYHAPVPGSAALIATLPGVTPPKAPVVPVIAPITAPVTPPVAAPVKTKAKPAPRTPPTSQTKSVRPESGAATRTAIRTLAKTATRAVARTAAKPDTVATAVNHTAIVPIIAFGSIPPKPPPSPAPPAPAAPIVTTRRLPTMILPTAEKPPS